MESDFIGKVIAVTGGMRGIGLAIAQVFAERGASVVIGDIVQSEIRDFNTPCLFLDVSQRESCRRFIETIENDLGRLDILVNNAGIFQYTPSSQLDESDWQSVLNVNLNGTFFCSKFAHPALCRSGGGAIVNMASINGQLGWPGRSNYAASKSAIMGLTRTLAVEWAGDYIRVNAVAPGYVNTDMVTSRTKDGGLKMEHLTARIPMKRIAEPVEIARVVAFLASDEASYITGQIINVDGGYLVYGGE